MKLVILGLIKQFTEPILSGQDEIEGAFVVKRLAVGLVELTLQFTVLHDPSRWLGDCLDIQLALSWHDLYILGTIKNEDGRVFLNQLCLHLLLEFAIRHVFWIILWMRLLCGWRRTL